MSTLFLRLMLVVGIGMTGAACRRTARLQSAGTGL
jgi:hypothetical protein